MGLGHGTTPQRDGDDWPGTLGMRWGKVTRSRLRSTRGDGVGGGRGAGLPSLPVTEPRGPALQRDEQAGAGGAGLGEGPRKQSWRGQEQAGWGSPRGQAGLYGGVAKGAVEGAAGTSDQTIAACLKGAGLIRDKPGQNLQRHQGTGTAEVAAHCPPGLVARWLLPLKERQECPTNIAVPCSA